MLRLGKSTIKVSLYFFLFLSTSVFATEVDSFTGTDRYLSDSTFELNKMANEWIDDALSNVRKSKGCSEKEIRKKMKKKFKRLGWSKFEIFITKSSQFDKITPSKKNIYRGFLKHGALGGRTKFLAPLIRVGDHLIGADKFSHFFTEGYNYSKRKSLQKALKYGRKMEKGLWGRLTMGIYSYADLAANYNGLLFYQSLTKGDDPYFECQNESWKRIRDFDFNDYIDASWDERINRSTYRSEKLEKVFNTGLSKLAYVNQEFHNTSEFSYKCSDIVEKYYELKDHLISPVCR